MKKNGDSYRKIQIYRKDIGIKFGIEKRAMLVIKMGKNDNGRNRTAKLRKNQNTRRKDKPIIWECWMQIPSNKRRKEKKENNRVF